MQKKYVKVLSNIFYELTPLTNDVICLKLYSDGENILASFCHTNTLIIILVDLKILITNINFLYFPNKEVW